MARLDYWRVNGLPNSITNLPLDGHPGPETTQRYGESYDFTVRLSERSNSPTQRWPDHVERYQRILDAYGPNAGQYTVHQLLDGTVAFTETHAGESLLMGVRPPEDAVASRGGYYLVESLEDSTTLPDRVCLLDLSLTYVADLDEYEDVSLAKDFLEAEPV